MYVRIEHVHMPSNESITVCIISPRNIKFPCIKTNHPTLDYWINTHHSIQSSLKTYAPRMISHHIVHTRPSSVARVHSLSDLRIVEQPVDTIDTVSVSVRQLTTFELNTLQNTEYSNEPWMVVAKQNVVCLVVGTPSDAPMDLIVSTPFDALSVKLVKLMSQFEHLESSIVIDTIDCVCKDKKKFYNTIRTLTKTLLASTMFAAMGLGTVAVHYFHKLISSLQ